MFVDIIRRDVKPSNMLMSSSVEIKMWDLSYRLLDSMGKGYLGIHNSMVPDVWSLGLVQ